MGFDVCVVGGGPAGAALALRLATLGRSVAIVERCAFPREHVGESLASGIAPLLDVLGVREAVEAQRFLSAAEASVRWAGEHLRYRVHGGPGWLVDRARFDAALLDAAAAHPGVRRIQPARVVRAERLGDHWDIALASGETVRARYLAEATGRAPLGPRSRRRIGAPTLELYAYWRGASDGDDGVTLVESGSDAWYWGAPLPGGDFNATVFVDAGAAGRRADYEGLIARSTLLAPRLRAARRRSEVRVCDATPSVDECPVTATSIKVGDAALSIDPLSSQGVQTALGTALHAAVVLNTLMDRPGDARLAIDFYRSRVRDSADFHASASADFYRRQAAVDDGDFWRRRAAATEPKRVRNPIAPDARVELAPGLRFEPVAVVDESYVVRRDGVRLGGRGYVFVGKGIAVAPLLRQIEGPAVALDVVERWSRHMPARQALEVLAWAGREGLLLGRAVARS